MATKKIKLQHVVFGDCVVIGAGLLTSSDESYLEVTCIQNSRKVTKKILCAKDYWLTDSAEVARVFDLVYSRLLLARKQSASRTHTAEAHNTKKQYIAPDRRQRNHEADAREIDAIEQHIEDLQIELPEVEDENDYTESETTSEDDYAQALEA